MPTQTHIPLILGTMTFGLPGSQARITDQATVQKALDTFGDYGHTELDTARMYCGGTTEEILGMLSTEGLVIDSKCFPVEPKGHEPAKLRASLEASLKALKTNKLRLFYLHAPDRSVPFETTLEECNNLYKEGKFDELALSNFASWEVAVCVGICERRGFIKPTVYQAMYNAITRDAETELIPCCRALGLRVVVYNPLAGGLFAGKVETPDQEVEKGSRFDPTTRQGSMYRLRYIKTAYFDALNLIKGTAKKHNIPLTAIALRWIQHHSALIPTDGVIFGASSIAQIKSNCEESAEGPLPEEVLQILDEAWEIVKPHCPPYWR